MARGQNRGRARRPTRFADGAVAWVPTEQQEASSSSQTRGTHQQEHTADPTGSTPEMETLGIETSGGQSNQPEETINASQLMQLMYNSRLLLGLI